MRTVAIIQARVHSSRLPGKVLLPLAGKSMLQNVVERVKRAKLLDEVIVAFPEGPENLSIPKIARECGIHFWFSAYVDENDLIGRFYSTAKACKADFIIRICADNPCVEPEEIDGIAGLVETVSDSAKWRLLSNAESFTRNHDGFGGELYSMEMLEWMNRTIQKQDAEFREHPHLFWLKSGRYDYVGKEYPEGFRLDVNTPADYERIKDIYDHFGHNHFTVKEVMEYLTTSQRLGENETA